jgi:hypothetical protein
VANTSTSPTKTRSPNYPAIGLGEAVQRIQPIYEKEFKHPADREVIAAHLGYSGLNGASWALTSALIKYGLLEAVGKQLKVSEDAIDVIIHPKGAEERVEAVERMAFLPTLFNELRTLYGDTPPSDNNLMAYLIKNNFNPKSVGDVIRSYRDTLEFVEAERQAAKDGQQIPMFDMPAVVKVPISTGGGDVASASSEPRYSSDNVFVSNDTPAVPGEPGLRFKVARDSYAVVTFQGPVTQEAVRKLIKHLELSADEYPTQAEIKGQEIASKGVEETTKLHPDMLGVHQGQPQGNT